MYFSVLMIFSKYLIQIYLYRKFACFFQDLSTDSCGENIRYQAVEGLVQNTRHKMAPNSHLLRSPAPIAVVSNNFIDLEGLMFKKWVQKEEMYSFCGLNSRCSNRHPCALNSNTPVAHLYEFF